MKVIICLAMFTLGAGCGRSKVELESTKTDIARTTRERDTLNLQVASLERQFSDAKSELEKERSAELQRSDKSGKQKATNSHAAIASKNASADSTATRTKRSAHKS